MTVGKPKKKPRDDAANAVRVARLATGEDEPEPEEPKNEHAQALSALGASKGGKARAKSLTPEQRSEIARKAAAARWKKQDEGE